MKENNGNWLKGPLETMGNHGGHFGFFFKFPSRLGKGENLVEK